MKEPIISVSGLRGIIGESLSPELAARFACAFASSLPSGPVMITFDGRASGEVYMLALNAGLRAIGRDVIIGDITATPTTGVLIREYQAAGGIQISASHNPANYNGLKLFSEEGQVLTAEQGERVLERYRAGVVDWVEHDALGDADYCDDTSARHLELVLDLVNVNRIRDRHFRVLLDSNHGAGSICGKRLLKQLDCDVTFRGEIPNGKFSHPPEPTAENLADVRREVTDCEADVGFCQDPDADRLAIIDDQGRYIGEEYTLALCLDHVLRTRPGPVVTNCATSRMSEDVARLHGCKFFRSAVGEANVVATMQAEKAVFGGEGNGGPIEPRVGYVRDSFVGMALVLDSMAAREQPISQLADSLPRYEIVKSKVSIDREQMPDAFDRMVEQFGDATASRLDGLRLDWDNKWVLVRASNTEPIVRIIAEAPDQKEAVGLCERASEVLAG